MLTAILSSFNELNNPVFWSNLDMLRAAANVELIVVDGGSSDGTRERLKGIQVIDLPSSQRGDRYNRGIEAARGDIVLLVHPRTALTRDAVEYLFNCPKSKNWGAFRHSFDWKHPVLRFTSWYSNRVRGQGRGIFYLDHCLFFSKDLIAHARFPSVGVFEDTYFSAGLRKVCRPNLSPVSVTTSAVRFRKNGVFRQSLINQFLKILFHLGASEKFMTRVYERGLWLN